MLAALAAAQPVADPRTDRLDPSWPPVLVAFVVVVIAAMAVALVVIMRAVRADVRRDGGTR